MIQRYIDDPLLQLDRQEVDKLETNGINPVHGLSSFINWFPSIEYTL